MEDDPCQTNFHPQELSLSDHASLLCLCIFLFRSLEKKTVMISKFLIVSVSVDIVKNFLTFSVVCCHICTYSVANNQQVVVVEWWVLKENQRGGGALKTPKIG